MTMSTWIICDAITGASPQDAMFSFILGLMPWIFLYLHYTATIWWTDRAYKTIQLLPPLQFPPPTVRKRPSCISGYFLIIQQEGSGGGTHHFALRDLTAG